MGRRLAFLGTPELAVPALRALVEAGHDVAVVLSRPDRRRGRGSTLSPSPVKEEATRLGIPVVTAYDDLLATSPELGVVVAFGRIIPVSVLDQVPMVNLHFSLLPRWRGAAPVERAILAGDEVTGVCVMAVEEGLDTGAVYASAETAVGAEESLDGLRRRLVAIGTDLLVQALAGPLPPPIPQVGEPTYAAKIAPGELALDWARPALELSRVVRVGGAWTTVKGRRLKVLAAAVVGGPGRPALFSDPTGGATSFPPGTVVDDVVATGQGWLALHRVQPEGRAALDAASWARGARLAPGERLGS